MGSHVSAFGAPVVAVSALALVLAGCGETPAEGRDALDPVVFEAAPAATYLGLLSEEQNIATQRLRARYQRWAGDVETRQAGQVVLAYANNAAMDDCIASRGADWAHGWQGAIGPASTSSYASGSLWLSPPERTFTEEALVNLGPHRLTRYFGYSLTKDVDQAMSECSGPDRDWSTDILGSVSEEEVGELIRPAVYGDLVEAWNDELVAIEDLAAHEEETRRCVREAGLPKPKLPALEKIPAPGEPVSAEWQHTLDVEEALVRATWECHADSYDEALAALDAAMDRFETAHAAEIDEVLAAHHRLRDLARRMGWAPGNPLAGLAVPAGDELPEPNGM